MSPHMPRPGRSIVGVCIAVIVLAACLPGMCSSDLALFEPHWVLLPDEVLVAIDHPVARGDEQPVSLLSLTGSRAPPAPPLA
jgi:hypothetical protein